MSKDLYILLLSAASDQYGDKLIDIMDFYGVDSLSVLSVQQFKLYCELFGITKKE